MLFGDVLTADDPDARALGEELRDPGGRLSTPAGAGVGELQALIAARRADLVVLAAPPPHALRHPERAALHHPPCHVAVAPQGYAGRERAVHTIGIGYRDTPVGRAVLDAARGLGWRWGAGIEAIQVVASSHWPAPDSGAGWRALAAGERLAEIPGIAGTAVEGDVRRAFSALARRVDLLILGPPVHGALAHLLRGDVIGHLAGTSPCPLVVIDPRTPTA